MTGFSDVSEVPWLVGLGLRSFTRIGKFAFVGHTEFILPKARTAKSRLRLPALHEARTLALRAGWKRGGRVAG